MVVDSVFLGDICCIYLFIRFMLSFYLGDILVNRIVEQSHLIRVVLFYRDLVPKLFVFKSHY